MSQLHLTPTEKTDLLEFFSKNRDVDYLTAYLVFLESKFNIQPVLYKRKKQIFQSLDTLLAYLEQQEVKGKLWKEAKVTISSGKQDVDEHTTKIFICPSCGKAHSDNILHKNENPQDTIYDHVSSCPQNKSVAGIREKRFFISDDPKVIKEYIQPKPEAKIKTLYASIASGKLFESPEAARDDFIKGQITPMTLPEVINQKKFDLEEGFVAFLQPHLEEDKISTFVQGVSELPEFTRHIKHWLADSEEEHGE